MPDQYCNAIGFPSLGPFAAAISVVRSMPQHKCPSLSDHGVSSAAVLVSWLTGGEAEAVGFPGTCTTSFHQQDFVNGPLLVPL